MIFSHEGQHLVNQWREALNANAAVITEFAALIKQGNLSTATADEYTMRMEETRLIAVDLLEQLRPFRLDI